MPRKRRIVTVAVYWQCYFHKHRHRTREVAAKCEKRYPAFRSHGSKRRLAIDVVRRVAFGDTPKAIVRDLKLPVDRPVWTEFGFAPESYAMLLEEGIRRIRGRFPDVFHPDWTAFRHLPADMWLNLCDQYDISARYGD